MTRAFSLRREWASLLVMTVGGLGAVANARAAALVWHRSHSLGFTFCFAFFGGCLATLSYGAFARLWNAYVYRGESSHG